MVRSPSHDNRCRPEENIWRGLARTNTRATDSPSGPDREGCEAGREAELTHFAVLRLKSVLVVSVVMAARNSGPERRTFRQLFLGRKVKLAHSSGSWPTEGGTLDVAARGSVRIVEPSRAIVWCLCPGSRRPKDDAAQREGSHRITNSTESLAGDMPHEFQFVALWN